ncbi:MAG: hypothetical protein QGH20_02040 [Candidatus Latescibacteria bacterium]|jgi:hypothetical protein|nr:hypothetical protein [Candidatus Latescibacterota bacterium]
MESFAPDTGYPYSANPWYVSQQSGSAEGADRLFALLQAYTDGEITLDELVSDYSPLFHRLAEEELRYSLAENIKMVGVMTERLAGVEVQLEELSQLPQDESMRAERRKLERRRAYTSEGLIKAVTQKSFIADVLSRQPAWAGVN